MPVTPTVDTTAICLLDLIMAEGELELLILPPVKSDRFIITPQGVSSEKDNSVSCFSSAEALIYFMFMFRNIMS